jgi:hypothetical protein
MDEFQQLMNETFNHFHQNFGEARGLEPEAELSSLEDELPSGPGVLYHIQKTSTVFVLRTLVSADLRSDYLKVLEAPEDFPTLRLLEAGVEDIAQRLKFFPVEEKSMAEIIHDHLCNRRFPINEEMMCNISDPGFSWWLTKREGSFQVSFTLSVSGGLNHVKLGALGDQQLALKSFQQLAAMFEEAGLGLNIENEMSRVQFSDGEAVLLEELQDLFELGVISDGLRQLFIILARRIEDHSRLETAWFYLQELASMRRFWIQIEYDLA